jgi:hypothetical protein
MVSERGDINGFQTFLPLLHQEGGLCNRVEVCFFSYFFRCDYETVKKKVLVKGGTVKRLRGRRRAFDEG